MTITESIKLLQDLPICNNLQGSKLTKTVVKNMISLERDSKEDQEVIKRLQEQHSKKDKEGKPIIVDNIYQMDDINAFNKDYVEFLNSECSVVFLKLTDEDIPENATVAQRRILYNFLEETV